MHFQRRMLCRVVNRMSGYYGLTVAGNRGILEELSCTMQITSLSYRLCWSPGWPGCLHAGSFQTWG